MLIFINLKIPYQTPIQSGSDLYRSASVQFLSKKRVATDRPAKRLRIYIPSHVRLLQFWKESS